MRMLGESVADKNYRVALENMRYKSCTNSDIRFLNILISSNLPGQPCAKLEPWQSAPIIVGENKYKDEINRLGTLRFASETNQQLLKFYSDDTIAANVSNNNSNKGHRGKKSPINTISEDLQKVLWDLPTSAYDLNCPPVLHLCIGLPVIIRHNVATELSITKGQKGFVYAWHTAEGKFSQNVLETVFVLLDEPPKDIKIKGLPLNVVPISRRKTTGYVSLPDDSKIHISRNQVDILPGFAMTAHASQGQSLHSNAIDLNTLTDHHAWYTALSRSRSAHNTLILQGFDSSKVTGGASGALRREYRELELLDEITTLRFQGKLSATICGSTRKLLIETFLLWKGKEHIPPHVHSSIKWSEKDPYIIEQEPLPAWTTMDKKSFQTLKQNMTTNDLSRNANISQPVSTSNAQKHRIEECYETTVPMELPPAKKIFESVPLTTVWSNNSCAFDTVFPIVYLTWLEEPNASYDIYSILPSVLEDFMKVKTNTMSLNEARDTYRRSLAIRNPRSFSFGNYCAVTELLEDLLRTTNPFIKSTLWCENNHSPRRQPHSVKHCNIPEIRDIIPTSTAQWLHENSSVTWSNVCHVCRGTLVKHYHFQYPPPIIVFPCDSMPQMQIDQTVHMRVVSNQENTYALRGVIYYSASCQHFFSRIITSQGFVYQHDGMSNAGNPILESTSLLGIDLNVCRNSSLTCVIYKLVTSN
ncbi:hypothetical protein EV360DRAFT_51659 [Lentinula raphanica]|nr:hypothetical protein EV360DRAFT_51659 [Lentinula raphanica]